MNININVNKNMNKSFVISTFKQKEVSEFESVIRAMEEHPEMKAHYEKMLKNMSSEPKGENITADFLPLEDLLIVCRFFENESSFLRKLFVQSCQNKMQSENWEMPDWTQDSEKLAVVLNALYAARLYGDADIIKDFCAVFTTQKNALTEFMPPECKSMILYVVKSINPKPFHDIYESRSISSVL